MIAAADAVLPMSVIDADNMMQESAHHNLKLSQIATFPLYSLFDERP